MKILFMGTPDFAAVSLRALLAARPGQVCAVLTQTDKPRGRGHEMRPSAVKVAAEEAGIPVYQPRTLRDEAFTETLAEIAPDIIAVVAYGKLLPKSVLDYPRYGCINVHGSLLPRYRGAAPIQRAIMEGERVTGITTMYMAEGLDTGDMLLREETPIGPDEDFAALHDRLAEIGGRLLCRTLDEIEAGRAIRVPQSEEGACYAAKIEKSDCALDFSLSAAELHNRIRGLSPIPLAYTHLPSGKLLKVLASCPCGRTEKGGDAPGVVLSVCDRGKGYIRVACGEGCLDLTRVKPEGKGAMSAADFIRGRGIAAGDRLQSGENP